MHSEKRLIVFALVMMASILTINFVMEKTGLEQPAKPKAKAKAKADPKDLANKSLTPPEKGEAKAVAGETPKEKEKEKAADAKPAEAPTPVAKAPAVPLLKPEELILGSSSKQSPDGYRLEVQLDQKGGGVAAVLSSQYEAEHERGKPMGVPLPILKYDPLAPLSLSTTIRDAKAIDALDKADILAPGETPLDLIVWEVVKDAQGRAVRTITRDRPNANGGAPKATEGQELTFRTKVDDLGLSITKTFRLFQGEDGFEFDLHLDSAAQTRSIIYRILGPHGIPIEGEWYTGTFREFVFEGTDGKAISPITAYDIIGKKEDQERFVNQPLKFAGIENQYFAALIGPATPPASPELRWDSETRPLPLRDVVENRYKSDIGVEIFSHPLTVGPGTPVKHTYRVYVGPKTTEALTPYGAESLATYRKSNYIPFAPYFAKAVITPLLNLTYDLTKKVAQLFGWKNGNYGIAIILLTMCVRLAMFPLSRKQAISAKKMQDLQPLMKEIQAKYADDKELQTKETWALYKRHGVNPISGCLPALIQLPIFVGLWQALNNSVSLRNASFIYIENLAAPDMLFRFPFDLPIISSYLGDYFNLLPFLVVGLMLVQTKLFSPPATTPEQEMQQNVMKYMMVFMAFMFYKVPSGLGIYFITSSLWQICERLLLPKLAAKKDVRLLALEAAGGGSGTEVGKMGPGGGLEPEKPKGRFAQFWERVLAEAEKNPTYRNLSEEREKNSGGGRDSNRSNGDNNGGASGSRDRDRNGRGPGPDRGKPRTRPGRGGR